jgi:hypothetical protein
MIWISGWLTGLSGRGWRVLFCRMHSWLACPLFLALCLGLFVASSLSSVDFLTHLLLVAIYIPLKCMDTAFRMKLDDYP